MLGITPCRATNSEDWIKKNALHVIGTYHRRQSNTPPAEKSNFGNGTKSTGGPACVVENRPIIVSVFSERSVSSR
jgi:hypothetical protein